MDHILVLQKNTTDSTKTEVINNQERKKAKKNGSLKSMCKLNHLPLFESFFNDFVRY